jgi:hypothetical protein
MIGVILGGGVHCHSRPKSPSLSANDRQRERLKPWPSTR